VADAEFVDWFAVIGGSPVYCDRYIVPTTPVASVLWHVGPRRPLVKEARRSVIGGVIGTAWKHRTERSSLRTNVLHKHPLDTACGELTARGRCLVRTRM
jgi:hypothetical protein